MKTTLFLLALYGVFGFFACKQVDATLKGAEAQSTQREPSKRMKPNLTTRLAKENNAVMAGSLWFKK